MIRKVYLDFIRHKLSSMDLGWIAKRAMQYSLTHASFLAGRPLCGPILGTLVTNYSCNYRCRMCDLPSRDEELRKRGLKEFDTNAMKRLIKDFSDLGCSGIGFTGGEPLLRKDIFELVSYTRSLGMITHLNTNGFFLTESAIQKVLDAKVDSINISLDGASPATHDAIRGHQGAFDHVLSAAACLIDKRNASGAAVRTKFVAVLDSYNIDEAPDLVRIARELGLDCIEFIPRQPFKQGKTEAAPPPDKAFLEKIDTLQHYLLTLQDPGVRIENSPAHIRLFKHSFRGAASPLACYAGYNSLAVDCYGEIYPCVPWVNWRKAVGNAGSAGLKEFWYSADYNKKRAEIAGCRKCYLNCQAELNILFNGMKLFRMPR